MAEAKNDGLNLHHLTQNMRLRSLQSLHPYLAGLPLRDIITLPNIAYRQR